MNIDNYESFQNDNLEIDKFLVKSFYSKTKISTIIDIFLIFFVIIVIILFFLSYYFLQVPIYDEFGNISYYEFPMYLIISIGIIFIFLIIIEVINNLYWGISTIVQNKIGIKEVDSFLFIAGILSIFFHFIGFIFRIVILLKIKNNLPNINDKNFLND